MNLFIRRPVLSAVISIIIVLLGLLALLRMPRALFPSVAPPEVNVTVEYTGANAEVVAKSAIVPLERAINGVPGMKYMSSDMGNDGVGVVQILFETGTDPDVAAINVQNRVNSVMDELPAEVIHNGVKIAKEENSMLLYLSIFSENPEHDEKFLYNFADINVLAELKRVPGVGYANILGAKEYAMRVWLRPDKMAAYHVSVADIRATLEEQNVEAAPGKIGENSDKAQGPLQYALTYRGKFNSKEAYENIPVRAGANGEVLRLKDVADVEFGTTYFDVEAKFNGHPTAAIMLKQLPGSNASQVIAEVKQRMAAIKDSSFLPGMDYAFSFDVSRFLDAAVDQVSRTFFEAFALVALVVFIFLQSWRSTLIAILAVPISLVGTFFFIQLLGFSLNLITLFALVLAIGIVVDDAIVVVEAVHATMERTGADARRATVLAMKDIRGPIIAITLVMVSVFLPMAFIRGPAGVFYREFALTMAVAITLSAVVALTLSPALSASILREQRHHGSPSQGRLGRWVAGFNARYGLFEQVYTRIVKRLAGRGLITGLALVVSATLALVVARTVPAGFIPNEDQGTFYASVTTPPGSTLERTKVIVDAIQKAGQGLEGVESIASLAGTNILSDATGATYGACLFNLVPWAQRTRSADDVMTDLERRIAHLVGADIELFPPPPVPGYGNASGFELRLLDKSGSGSLQSMDAVVKQFLAELRARPEIERAFTIFDTSFPQYRVDLDLDKAIQRGVTAHRALATLQTMLGSEYATNFVRFGQMYKVMMQSPPEYRSAPEQLLRLQVKNEQGELVPLSAFTTLAKTYGPDQITRYNMYTSAEFNGEGKAGISSGTILRVVQDTAKEKLPRGYSIDWAGISRDEVAAGNQGLFVFLSCLVFVYLVLCAQYESFKLPFAVILSLAPGVCGAFALLRVAALENNIYTHLALVMLIGLLGKNAILIVEYAELGREKGLTPFEAAVAAARLRLRPILMTSFAFIAGLVPLAVARGAGAMANRTIGTAAIGGMLLGTVIGVLIIPGLYVIFAPKGLSRAQALADGVSAGGE